MNPRYPARVLVDVRNPNFASFLDAARWVAASIVFLGHLRNPLFLGYGSLSASEKGIAVQLWYFVTGWFGPAVIVFFVLSGYLVGGIASARINVGRFSTSSYAIDRLSRLYVAFLPALLLTAALDLAGSNWFAATGFWNHQQPMLAEKVTSAPFESLLTFELFLGNLLMLQTISLPPFGSNGPLWTISLEFWFYSVFALASYVYVSRGRVGRAMSVLALAIMLVFLGKDFAAYMGLWLIGVCAAFAPWRSIERPLLAGAGLLGVLVAARVFQDAMRQIPSGIWLRDYCVAISFGWVLVSMRSTGSRLLGASASFNKFMADFSYSLYLIHFPLMLFLLGALHATGAFDGVARGYSPTSPEGLSIQALVIVATYMFAWLFSTVTERRTPWVRAKLKALVGGAATAAIDQPRDGSISSPANPGHRAPR